MVRAYIMCTVLLAAFLAAPAYAAEPDVDDYITRHVTFWYHGEHEFIRFEDSLRTSPRPLVGRYGPENDFLMWRIEEIYSVTTRILGIDPEGFRVNVELAGNSNNEELRGRDEGARMLDDFGVYFDPRSNTVYIDSSEPGPRALGAALAVALLAYGEPHTPPRPLVEAAINSVRSGFRED